MKLLVILFGLMLLSMISFAATTIEISKAPVVKSTSTSNAVVTITNVYPIKPAPLVCSPGKVLYGGGIYTTITIICG